MIDAIRARNERRKAAAIQIAARGDGQWGGMLELAAGDIDTLLGEVERLQLPACDVFEQQEYFEECRPFLSRTKFSRDDTTLSDRMDMLIAEVKRCRKSIADLQAENDKLREGKSDAR